MKRYVVILTDTAVKDIDEWVSTLKLMPGTKVINSLKATGIILIETTQAEQIRSMYGVKECEIEGKSYLA